MAVNKRVFTVNDLKLAVRRPAPAEKDKADLVYGRSFHEAMESGLVVRAGLERQLRKMNLWDDEAQAKQEELVNDLFASEKKLAQGGKAGLTKKQGRDLALKIRSLRMQLAFLRRPIVQYDNITAEAYAEQRRFDYYVSVCTLDETTGKPYFSSLEDYKARTGDKDREQAAIEFAKLDYDVDETEKKLIENKFLLEYGFCNEKYHLVDKDGNLINAAGQRINEAGDRINEDGVAVDEEGDPVEVEFAPFLEDEEEGAEETPLVA